jgi:hypothetical protein
MSVGERERARRFVNISVTDPRALGSTTVTSDPPAMLTLGPQVYKYLR